MKKYIAIILAAGMVMSFAACSGDTEDEAQVDLPVVTATEEPKQTVQLTYGIAISNSTALDFAEIYAVDPDSGVRSENLLSSTLYEWESTPATLTGAFSSNVFDFEIVHTDGGVDTVTDITVNDGSNIDLTYNDGVLSVTSF